ncbi:methyl-accepting chemotaxis protein [Parahaliea mediterranea]|uniref:Cache domain-containing protein n=1 Tax=Parahaliea mediterranea TaxID=651086 RepID=A0A939DDV3_9GAMM|nr:methyl-accepting chemotaxis protein [Parahaliea mediterranea]MBN7796363.1 cache domain-containing protein [Parahaliea mediterranea]
MNRARPRKGFQFSLQSKVLLLALAPLLLVTIALVTLSAVERARDTEASLAAQRELLIATKVKGLEYLITAAKTAVNELMEDPELDPEQAREQARDMLRSMRFEGSNYIFTYSYDHFGVVMPDDPPAEGKDISDLQTVDGMYLVKEIVRLGREGGGEINYRLVNLNTGEIEQKYSYIAAIPEWEWVLGAGVYVTEIDKAMADVEAVAAQNLRFSIMTTVAAGLISFVVVAFIAAWLARRTVRPIRDTAQAMEDIAKGEGDLTRRLAVHTRDEVGELAKQFNAFVERMQETLVQVRGSTRHVHRAAEEIAHGSGELASRTEQAAANLQETSTSMEEITVTVKNTSDSAQQANQLASDTVSVARNGEQAMAQVESTMGDISRSAGQIGEIIGLIDGIAFQTNILALNASVEAARAGEHGRGFAVVAQEVRTLASRSADAARDIRQLIDTSVRHTEEGSDMVRQAGDTMREIVGSVTRVTDVIGEISCGTREQSGGIGQINTAVAELDSVTQQNAEMVQQTSTAAAEMRVHADRLSQLINSFVLGDDGDKGEPRAAPAPVASLEGYRKQPAATAATAARETPEREEEWAAF